MSRRRIPGAGPAARTAVARHGWICSATLLFLVFSIGLRLDVSGVVVTPERLLGLFLILLCPAWLLSSGRIRSSPRFVDYLYVAWLIWAAAVTLVSMPVSMAVRGFVPLLLAAVFYLAPRYVRFLSPRLLADRRAAVVGTIIFGLGGIVSFALSEPGPRRAMFTVLEPNLYGAIMAFFSLLAVHNFDRNRRLLSTGVLLLAHLGLLLGFSRGPWLGYAVGLIFYILLAKRAWLSARWLSSKALTPILAVVVGCAVFIYIMGPLTHVFDYISPPPVTIMAGAEGDTAALGPAGSDGRDGGPKPLVSSQTLETRMTLWRLAWNDLETKPVTGLGVLSFAHRHLEVLPQIGGDSPRNVWISNIVLGVLHDTGLVGLLLVLGFVVPLLAAGTRVAWQRTRSVTVTVDGRSITDRSANGQRAEAAAFWLAIFLAFLVVSQTTSMLTLGVLWLALGCLSYIVAQAP